MSKNSFFHHLTSKDKRPKSKVFFDNRLSKTTSPRDKEFFMVESLRTKDKSPFFLRLRVYKTTGLRVFSFELELRIHGTASIGKSQTATAPTVVCCPLSCKANNRLPPKSPLSVVLQSQSPMLIVRSLLSVVLQPPNQLPTKSLLSVVRCPQRTKQPSRGYQRGRQMRKRLFIQLLTATCALRFGFAKIRRTKLPLSTYVYLCPFMSTYFY